MNKNSKIRIVIVGGGSYIWTPQIIKDFMLTPSIANSEFVLYDKNLKAAEFCKAFLEKVGEQLSVKPNITATDNRAKAFSNADYFIITIASGGLEAMGYDLSIPEKYSIYHTVGDTTGPAGWARTIRNFDTFAEMGQAISKYAPSAVVFNYSNPMPALTDILTRTCSGQVVGLCRGIAENYNFVKDFYNLKSEKQITFKYAGLNHFFWITEAKVGNIDVIADLRRHLKRKSLNNLLHIQNKKKVVFASDKTIADELFRLTGAMPFLGDRHTCEYFSWFITNKKNMKLYNITRTSIAQRRLFAANRYKKLQTMLKKNKIEDWCLKRSYETVANFIEAHLYGKAFTDIGNTVNAGQIKNLPYGSVVETAIKADRNGFKPVNFGELPEPIASFCMPYARIHKMIVDACFEHNKQLAFYALRLDPICAHLNTKQVRELGECLLAANKKFITVF